MKKDNRWVKLADAIPWATRNGYENPEALAEWSEIMGDIEFDVYASDFPTCYSWEKAGKMITEDVYPVLGKDMFRYYRTEDDFDKKIAKCQNALDIADKFKNKYFHMETKVVLSYVKLAKYIYKTGVLSRNETLAASQKTELDNNLKALAASGRENTEAIKEWRGSLGPKEKWHNRVNEALNATENTVKQILSYVKNKDF